MSRSSGPSDSLAPPSPYPQHVDPSPTDSNGTESTEIEDDAQETHSEQDDDDEVTVESNPQSPADSENVSIQPLQSSRMSLTRW